ncbi:MAG: class I adenylate-forming enzyme family protein [Hyphomicrobiaceae bacterium]|nr:class I adenylate-forming enzyme family protein [Hyphomicrobiaceae bacterium]
MHAPFSRTAFELLSEQASRAPNAPAVIATGVTTSFSELHDKASRVARALRSRGIRRGDGVGILINNRLEWLEIFFGAAALGATVVPLSTWSKGPELDFLLTDSSVRCLFLVPAFGGQDFAGEIAALRASGRHDALERVVLVDGSRRKGFEWYADYREAAPLGELPPGEAASASDTLVVLYTSGSSNRPKAVPLQHYAAIENGFNIGERQGLVPGDRVLVAIPLFWSYGAVNALPATMGHGATLVLQSRFEPGEALDLIERHRCTALYTLPAMTNALVAHPAFAAERTRSLRTGVTIGAPQDVRKAAEVLGAARICNIYGSTETYGNCCVTPNDWSLDERAQCQGPPLPGVRLRVRHPETGALLGPGEVGDVEVTGYLMPGYRGDSARHNADVLTADGWFRTGDLGSLDDIGHFRFAGRSSEMIKRSGINVSPAEVEEALQQHPAVGLAGVTGRADPDKGEAIVAYIVPRPGRALSADELVAHCRARLSGYKVPDVICLAEALPLTPTGKLMRRELKALAEKDMQA